MIEIFNLNYNEYVDIVGTAHFTRRSIKDAYDSITAKKPKDIALELDWKRFQLLNTACLGCPRRGVCKGICEFTGAAEALGNINANIWLIDMTEQEIGIRIKSKMTLFERAHRGFRIYSNLDENPIRLWEKGFKDRVINDSKRRIATLRKVFPSVWRVLIDERNALMAARLAWITSKKLNEERNGKILAFVGAAHVEEMTNLLMNPVLIAEKLREFNLSFTEPILVRRVAVQARAR